MASTVGHSLAGLCIYALTSKKSFRDPVHPDIKSLAFFAFLANLPDLDFLIGVVWYGKMNAIHGEITHSLLFLVLAALAFGALPLGPWPFWKRATVAFFLIGSHDLIDFFSSQNLGLSPAYGIHLFYPFDPELIGAPVTLFYGVRHKNLDQLLSLENVWTVLYEMLIFIPLLLLIDRLKRKDRLDANASDRKSV
jgi:membrane-bound metal-dependent hydrolase YbcI (DUF457 family)